MRYLILIALFTIGCNERVPPGHIGRVQTPDGFTGEILGQGRHPCWGRDQMYYIEASDKTYPQKMNVLCKDQLNFGFTISVLAAVDRTKTKLIKAAFENVTPAPTEVGPGNLISAAQLYDMYVRPVVDQEARKVISKYETGEIVKNRRKIIEELRTGILGGLKTSIVKVRRVTVNNLDFPKSITKAQEERARRRVEIQTEKAEQEKRLVIEQNKIKLMQLKYKRKLVEAAAVADSNRIIGASVSPGFLAYYQYKNFSEAAKGPNNWGFIPYTDYTKNITGRAVGAALDAALRKRLEDARKSAVKAGEAPAPAPKAK